MIGSTCFGHYYVHHQELITVVPITTGWISVRAEHLSILPAPNFRPTATQEPDGPCGNQHYSNELLMMGIVVPETC